MTGELLINGKDAFDAFGVSIGEGFLDALLAPPPQKDYIENSSRLEDGKRISGTSKKDERTLTLVFSIEGSSKPDYLAKLKLFYAELGAGVFKVNVPSLGSEIYKLYYQKPAGFAANVGLTASKISVSFIEPNPTDRS